MLIVYLLNIAFYFWSCVLKLFFFKKYFTENSSLNPFVIYFVVSLPIEVCKLIIGPLFILEDSYNDHYYNFAILMSTIANLVDYLLMILVIKLTQKYTFKNNYLQFSLNPAKMYYTSIVFYFLFILSFILLSSSSYGVVNWLKNPREGYQFHRSGAGQFFIFAISFLSVSFTICAIFVKNNYQLFLGFLFFCFSAYFLGSKGILLDFSIFLFIVLWLKKSKHIKKIFFVVMPLSLILMLANFASSTAGGTLNALEMKEVFSYFDHYVNATTYYKAFFQGEIPYFYGKIYFTDFWGLVPRSLFPNKPYVYGITHVNEIFWPGAAELTNTPAFAGMVNYFADFGIFGVIFFSFFNPIKIVSYFFLGQLLKNFNYDTIKTTPLIFCLFCLFISPYFLTGLLFPNNLIFLIFVITIIVFVNRFVLKYKSQ